MQHLERFRNTGRVVNLTSDMESEPLEHLHSNSEAESLPDDHGAPWYILVRRNMDHFLLAIEILAVIGLFFVIYSGIHMLQNI